MPASVKGFGRRPFATVGRGAGAGVQKPPKEETAGEEGRCLAGATYGDLRVGDGAPASTLKAQVADRVGRRDEDERVRSCGCEARARVGARRGSAKACEGIAFLVRRAAESESDRQYEAECGATVMKSRS